MNASEPQLGDEDLGREAARLVWWQGLKQSAPAVPTRAFADAAIAEFRKLQEMHSTGIISDFIDGAVA